MNKDIKYFAIDISALVFDVTDSNGNYHQFKNNATGFKKFVKLLDANSHCVMETTGYYHYQLAYYLLEHGIKVSVENPLAVKRFIQMKLSNNKTPFCVYKTEHHAKKQITRRSCFRQPK